jgi:hypothetical protein
MKKTTKLGAEQSLQLIKCYSSDQVEKNEMGAGGAYRVLVGTHDERYQLG